MLARVIDRKKILITGATGLVARPIAEALAAEHEVWALGRFGARGSEDQLRAKGIRTWRWNMGRDSLAGLPSDFTHVLHAAVRRGDDCDFDTAIEINTAALGQLMAHCHTARAFIYISSAAVYTQQRLDHLYVEADPIGGVLELLPVYPVLKIACEGVVRAFSAAFGMRTAIARLNFAYGSYGHGGVPTLLYRELLAGKPIPIPFAGRNLASPIHTGDLVNQVLPLWEVAACPALIVNWGGDETVGLQDCVEYIATMTGIEPLFVHSNVTRQSWGFDNTRRRALMGNCSVAWKDGFRQTIAAHFPHAIRQRPSG